MRGASMGEGAMRGAGTVGEYEGSTGTRPG